MEDYDITAVICTYNRSGLLSGAIERMLAQEAGGLHYELIIVDNNSSDDTRRVVESYIAQGFAHVRYVFEGQQGLSYARNTGVANARAPIVAFTDDDIRVAPDWLVSITRMFRSHPDVGFGGGKVLPDWPHNPPAWLNKDHWSPLALLDRGDEPIPLNSPKSFVLVGANLAVRTRVFSEVGFFLPKFQRVKDSIGSTEDHDFQLRLHEAGVQGLYAPDVVVTAAVQEDRLTKTYHRRWHAGHGRFCAWMGIEHLQDGGPRLFNIPAHLYRRFAWFVRKWAVACARLNQAEALRYENEIRYLGNYMRVLHGQASAAPGRSLLAEITSFASVMVRRKLSAMRRATPPRHLR